MHASATMFDIRHLAYFLPILTSWDDANFLLYSASEKDRLVLKYSILLGHGKAKNQEVAMVQWAELSYLLQCIWHEIQT